METAQRKDRPSWIAEISDQDAAARLMDQGLKERVELIRALPKGRAASVFSYLRMECQRELLEELDDQEIKRLLTVLPPDDRTALLQEVPGNILARLLAVLPEREAHGVRQLLEYPPNSVGRLMTPAFVAVRPDCTIGEAAEHIRRRADTAEIDMIYVIDAHGRLVDEIDLREFVLKRPGEPVRSIMDNRFVSVLVHENRARAVELIQHYDLRALPVVDDDGVLLGIVTFDDVMDVAEQEATEDFHKLGGTTGGLRGSLRDASMWLLYRKRISWLVVLVFANLLTGLGIAYFEETIEAVVALVFFLPLIIASGGNAGAQAATLMVRAMATGDVAASDWLRLMGRELAVSSGLGLTMGALIWGIGVMRGGEPLGLVVTLSMIGVVVLGSMTGVLLPFLLQRLKLDPATASAPLVTSMVDVFGVLVYFGIASAILDVA